MILVEKHHSLPEIRVGEFAAAGFAGGLQHVYRLLIQRNSHIVVARLTVQPGKRIAALEDLQGVALDFRLFEFRFYLIDFLCYCLFHRNSVVNCHFANLQIFFGFLCV